MSDHILLAYGFDGKGGGKSLTEEEISNHIKENKMLWIHLDAINVDTKTWLKKETPFLDPLIIEALLAEETRPRMTQIADSALLILRGVNLNENANPEDMISIRFWIDEHRIISLRKKRLKAVLDIEQKIKQGKGPKNSGELICMLTSRLYERMQPVLSELDEKTDNIEEKILENADTELRGEIVAVRKKAILLRRYISPQRDAISQLHMADLSWLTSKNKIQLQETFNHVTRYVEDLDSIRERAQIVKDELANLIADKLNNNMYTLSVIAAIFLPLGFLTGLLGINIGGIPGAENANAFLIFCGIIVTIVALQIIVFKKFKWF